MMGSTKTYFMLFTITVYARDVSLSPASSLSSFNPPFGSRSLVTPGYGI